MSNVVTSLILSCLLYLEKLYVLTARCALSALNSKMCFNFTQVTNLTEIQIIQKLFFELVYFAYSRPFPAGKKRHREKCARACIQPTKKGMYPAITRQKGINLEKSLSLMKKK